MKKVYFVFLMFLLWFRVCDAQTADGIINNYFEKTGGADNWRSLQSIKMKATMNMQGMELTGNIYSKRPNKQRSEFEVMGQSVIQAYDGQDAWMINPFMGVSTAQAIPEEMAKSMKENDFESQFLDYAIKGNSVELVGTDTAGGREAFKIKLTKKNGDVEYHYFDKASCLPVMMKTTVSEGPQKGTEAEVYFSEFRPVGKLVFPFTMETKTNGNTLQKITFVEIDVDVPIPDSLFIMPKN